MARQGLQKGRRAAGRPFRGASLAEFLAVVLILSFVIGATGRLLTVGERQQRLGRGYSQAQSDLREALRVATRALRHGYAVVSPSTETQFPTSVSNADQVIVRVPEPGGGSQVEVRLHVLNGVLYAQRSDENSPGRALITGVRSAGFAYYVTSGTVRASSGGNPPAATEVEIALTANRESWSTTVRTLVTMRNRIAGSI